jgi:glycosyltransferase involved in cell wall biosynthesis
MPSGKVSIIVPTYNRAYCLPLTLQSLQRQTYVDWEALVIDDGSTDETAALMERLGKQDARIRYFWQANRGVSAARNTGLRLADGDWIGFLDSDDSWEPWKLSAQIACMEMMPEVGMIWTDMDAVDKGGSVVSRHHLRKMYGAYSRFPERPMFQHERMFAELAPNLAGLDERLASAVLRWGDLYSAMIVGSLVHTSTVLLRRSRAAIVGFFNEEMRSGEDYEFHLRTCREGAVGLLDVASIHYRLAGGEDQLTATKYRVEIAQNALTTRSEAIARDRARISLRPGELREIIASANVWVGDELFKIGDFVSARRHFFHGATQVCRKPKLLARAILTLLPGFVARALLRLYSRSSGLG